MGPCPDAGLHSQAVLPEGVVHHTPLVPSPVLRIPPSSFPSEPRTPLDRTDPSHAAASPFLEAGRILVVHRRLDLPDLLHCHCHHTFLLVLVLVPLTEEASTEVRRIRPSRLRHTRQVQDTLRTHHTAHHHHRRKDHTRHHDTRRTPLHRTVAVVHTAMDHRPCHLSKREDVRTLASHRHHHSCDEVDTLPGCHHHRQRQCQHDHRRHCHHHHHRRQPCR
mmetsp:Transcript_17774/g.50366  ORF Transcript_17774/g.50366 Transcript_17774/m.50366 type:complete len:220 (-) Transcript_17774:895-1554(-)